jgi:hypothetical protein
MDDELRQVQEEIAATKADLTEAKRERKEELVLSLTNLLTRLYQKELFLLSAGGRHGKLAHCDVLLCHPILCNNSMQTCTYFASL